jgi:hypothetical protein
MRLDDRKVFPAPDEVYALVRERFDDAEIVSVTLALVAINGWNRLAVEFRSPVGHYLSPRAVAAEVTE